MRREVGNMIPLELMALDGFGLVLRWCPLEGPYTHLMTKEVLEELLSSLQQQIVSWRCVDLEL